MKIKTDSVIGESAETHSQIYVNEMNAIFGARNKSKQLREVHFFDAIDCPEKLIEMIDNIYLRPYLYPGTWLIPYHLGNNYWAGLVLKFNDKGKLIRAIYCDPLEHKESNTISNHIKQQISQKLEILETKNVLVQPDLVANSGTLTIENLLLLATSDNAPNRILSKDEIQKMRKYHLEILKLYRPDYYQKFYEKQDVAFIDQKPKSITAIDQALLDAAKQGDCEGIKTALRKGANLDVNDQKNNHFRPADWAVYGGHFEAMKLFFTLGVSAHDKNINGHSLRDIVNTHRGQAHIKPLHDFFKSQDEALLMAAPRGDLDGINKALRNGADLNARDTMLGYSPLHYACRSQHYEIAKYLMDLGANPHQPNDEGESPRDGNVSKLCFFDNQDRTLSSAAWDGDFDGVIQALHYGADINVKDWEGNSPLYRAVQCGHLEIAKYLINLGANIHQKNHNGHTARDIAHTNHWSFIKNYFKDQDKALFTAVQNDDLEGVNQTIRNGADINARSEDDIWNSPLLCAIVNGNLEITKQLLRLGVDPHQKNDKGKSARYLCKMYSKVFSHVKRIHEFFIEQDNALFHAAHNNDRDGVNQALVNGADINARNKIYKGNSPLQYAVGRGHLPLTKYLLSLGADAHLQDDEGDSARDRARLFGIKPVHDFFMDQDKALFQAAYKGDCDSVNQALRNGADLNARHTAYKGKSPLQFAILRGHLELTKHLLSLGADPRQKNDEGHSARDLARIYQGRSHVKPLHDFFMKQDEELFNAADRGDRNSVDQALVNGADLNARDKIYEGGNSPLQYAVGRGHLELTKYLLSLGADPHQANDEDFSARDRARHFGIKPVHDFFMDQDKALFQAVKNGNSDGIEQALLNGADVNAKDADQGNPLHSAIKNGHPEIAKYLMILGADPRQQNQKGHTARDIARDYQGRFENKSILNYFKDQDIALLNAAKVGNRAAVEQALCNGADINARDAGYNGHSPLQHAVERGPSELAIYLIGLGADPHQKNYVNGSARDSAFALSHLQHVRPMLNYFKDQDNALLNAAKVGKRNAVEQALCNGADINARDAGYHGHSPLQHAVERGPSELAIYLIDLGADPHQKNYINGSARDSAFALSHLQHVRPMLNYFKDQDIALLNAARVGNRAAVEQALCNGADINARDAGYYGHSPLQHAVERGPSELAIYLISLGADSLQKNYVNGSARDSAFALAHLPHVKPMHDFFLAKDQELYITMAEEQRRKRKHHHHWFKKLTHKIKHIPHTITKPFSHIANKVDKIISKATQPIFKPILRPLLPIIKPAAKALAPINKIVNNANRILTPAIILTGGGTMLEAMVAVARREIFSEVESTLNLLLNPGEALLQSAIKPLAPILSTVSQGMALHNNMQQIKFNLSSEPIIEEQVPKNTVQQKPTETDEKEPLSNQNQRSSITISFSNKEKDQYTQDFLPVENTINNLRDKYNLHIQGNRVDLEENNRSRLSTAGTLFFEKNSLRPSTQDPLLRGGVRPPEQIFKEGYKSPGTNMDVLNHVCSPGNQFSKDSGYVSTSTSKKVAAKFPKEIPYETKRTYIYEIEPQSNGVNIIKEFPKLAEHSNNKELYMQAFNEAFKYEKEISIPLEVKPQHIRGAWPVDIIPEGIKRSNNVPSNAVFSGNHYRIPQEGPQNFIPNPNYNPLSQNTQRFFSAGKAVGRLATGAALTIDAINLNEAYQQTKTTGNSTHFNHEATRIAGGWAGAGAVGSATAQASAIACAPAGPLGSAACAVVGGLVGSYVGYRGGEIIAQDYNDVMDNPGITQPWI